MQEIMMPGGRRAGKTFAGWDPGAPGGDRTVVQATQSLYMRRGDRVTFDGEPNSVRHFVKSVASDMMFELATYVRPSKGFRRHLRRQKARKRRA